MQLNNLGIKDFKRFLKDNDVPRRFRHKAVKRYKEKARGEYDKVLKIVQEELENASKK